VLKATSTGTGVHRVGDKFSILYYLWRYLI